MTLRNFEGGCTRGFAVGGLDADGFGDIDGFGAEGFDADFLGVRDSSDL